MKYFVLTIQLFKNMTLADFFSLALWRWDMGSPAYTAGSSRGLEFSDMRLFYYVEKFSVNTIRLRGNSISNTFETSFRRKKCFCWFLIWNKTSNFKIFIRITYCALLDQDLTRLRRNQWMNQSINQSATAIQRSDFGAIFVQRVSYNTGSTQIIC